MYSVNASTDWVTMNFDVSDGIWALHTDQTLICKNVYSVAFGIRFWPSTPATPSFAIMLSRGYKSSSLPLYFCHRFQIFLFTFNMTQSCKHTSSNNNRDKIHSCFNTHFSFNLRLTLHCPVYLFLFCLIFSEGISVRQNVDDGIYSIVILTVFYNLISFPFFGKFKGPIFYTVGSVLQRCYLHWFLAFLTNKFLSFLTTEL